MHATAEIYFKLPVFIICLLENNSLQNVKFFFLQNGTRRKQNNTYLCTSVNCVFSQHPISTRCCEMADNSDTFVSRKFDLLFKILIQNMRLKNINFKLELFVD